jgi:hypothetical protein
MGGPIKQRGAASETLQRYLNMPNKPLTDMHFVNSPGADVSRPRLHKTPHRIGRNFVNETAQLFLLCEVTSCVISG